MQQVSESNDLLNEISTKRFIDWGHLHEKTQQDADKVPGIGAVARIIREPDGRARYQQTIQKFLSVTKYFHNDGFQGLGSCDISEFAVLHLDQVVRNHRVKTKRLDASRLVPLNQSGIGGIIRRFNQLPCSIHTLEARAQIILSLGGKDQRILLIGDDDFLSVFLANAGFSNITVLEIDSKLIQRIEGATDRSKVKCIQCDISKPTPSSAISDYDVVVFDPICSLEGCKTFFDTAIKCVTNPDQVHFLLCTNLRAMLRSGAAGFLEYLSELGMKLIEFHEDLNIYPLSSGVRTAMRGMGWVFGPKLFAKSLWSNEVRIASELNYFVSDGYLFKRAKS